MASIAVLPLLAGRADSQGCQPAWVPTFGQYPGLDQEPLSTAVFDPGDGSGPGLYFTGSFEHAGPEVVNGFARWDGAWSAARLDLFDWLDRLFAFDDGNGPALVASGRVGNQTRIGRWDGTSWVYLGGHLVLDPLGRVKAFAAFDAGSGPELYVGGGFTAIDGVAAGRIARWDGAAWHPLAGGLDGQVTSLAVFDDGSGPALYAGGGFTSANGLPANFIARWDGTSWNALPAEPDGAVLGLIVHDDGGGPALFASGFFTSAGGVPANHVARWDGTVWAALDTGTDQPFENFALYDDGSGSGSQLFAGGSFMTAGGLPTGGIARWDGASWSGLPGVAPLSVSELVTYDDGGGAGAALFIVGDGLWQPDGAAPYHVARWDGLAWQALANGVIGTLMPPVRSMRSFDDGSGGGRQLFAGGAFLAGGAGSTKLAKWNGASWESLLPPTLGSVNHLETFDDGSGEALYVSGNFSEIGGVAANSIARWNGTSWAAVGIGSPNGVGPMAVHDDGAGPRLVAIGRFPAMGAGLVDGPAVWDGVDWTALGTGIAGAVRALATFEQGGQRLLVAAGFFMTAGGVSANHIAAWDGAGWAPLGTGLDNEVDCLAVFDDGAGPALYAGGRFMHAGGLPADFVARWDGTAWSALGSGVSDRVWCMTVFDEGAGPALFVGGDFTSAGMVSMPGIGRWDGTGWSALGLGLSDSVRAMAILGDGSGPGAALCVSGNFFAAPESLDSFLASWQGCPDRTAPVIDAPAAVLALDRLFGPPGEVVTFTVRASDANDPHPDLECVPPSGSFFPLGTTLVTCTASDAAGNVAVRQFPVTVRLKARRR